MIDGRAEREFGGGGRVAENGNDVGSNVNSAFSGGVGSVGDRDDFGVCGGSSRLDGSFESGRNVRRVGLADVGIVEASLAASAAPLRGGSSGGGRRRIRGRVARDRRGSCVRR